MNSLILAFDITFAIVAAILSILSWHTFRAIRHLRVGRSFWIPTFVSGAVFLVGSIFAILQQTNLQLTTNTNEATHVSQILALCILVGGIYSYSRKVKGSLTKRFSIQEGKDLKNIKTKTQEGLTIEVPQERKVPESTKVEAVSVCKRQFGYLRMLPIGAVVPNECLNCSRLMECRYSLPEVAQAQKEKPHNKK
jgi:hypothetical protein